MAAKPNELSAKNPLVYNPITLGIPVMNKLFGKKKSAPFVSGMADEAAYANQDFQEIFGREPTAAELAQIVPSYVGTDQHIPNKAQGKAFIAQMYQTQENTPDKIYARQQAEYKAKAPEHYGSVGQSIESALGRKATTEELEHFGTLLASGTTDAYQLQEFLKQQPEYTQKQDQTFRDQLSGQLQENDKRYFGEKILPGIQESYAKQGRSFDSSAFQNAATQSAQQQNTERESFLANLSASQYGGRQQNAYNDYANQVANQQGMSNFNLQSQYQGMLSTQNRANEIMDYNTQSNAYNQYLAKYGKRNPMGAAFGGAVQGAMLGSKFGPWGALAGGVAGGAGGYMSGKGSY